MFKTHLCYPFERYFLESKMLLNQIYRYDKGTTMLKYVKIFGLLNIYLYKGKEMNSDKIVEKY